MKKLLLTAMAAFLATGLAPMSAARADGPSDEASFVAQINGLRVTKGLPALSVDAGLTGKARAWAQTMADKNTIWHSVLTDGITADWQKLGENVGMGASVDSLNTAFVNSPHHYENLVDPLFSRIGIGVVHGVAGTLFVAEEFMQLRSTAVTAVVAKAPVVTLALQAPVVKAPVVKAPAVPPAALPTKATEPVPETTAVHPEPEFEARRAVPFGTWICEL